jgi:sugar phosphate permease
MKPGTVWIGIVLIAVGLCGMLNAAGVVDSSQTIGQWWPLAVLGWPVADMLGARRLTVGGMVCAAVGLALLADAQEWTSDVVVWSALPVFVGTAVLTAALYRRLEQHDGTGAGTPVNGAVS